ncbi:MAG: ROK family protein [Chloroflexi bacterium]|nr:ROK family protein [Chloroflexota bacterium]
MSEQLIIGIDLGGTKISTALANSTGDIIAHDYRETRAAEGLEAVIDRMLNAARRVMALAGVETTEITAVGLGAPGPVNVEAGVLVTLPNFPGWDRVSLKQLIETELGITTFMDNDANAAALGEHRFGAG